MNRTVTITRLRDGKYSFVEHRECQKKRLEEPFFLNDRTKSLKLCQIFAMAKVLKMTLVLRYDKNDKQLTEWINEYV